MRDHTRTALILAYDHPPCRAPGAAVRTAKFAQYLPELGWEPIVVCRDDGTPRERVSDRIQAVPAPFSESISYQIAAWTWALRVRDRVRGILRDGSVDLVYVTGPPFPPVSLAAELRRSSGIPLVVDFRDSWSLDPYEGGPWPKRLLKRWLCRSVYPQLERRVLGAADAVVTNTPSMARAMAAPPFSVASTLIPNGYDEADFPAEPQWQASGRGTEFLYCGRFAGIAGRSAEPVLQGLRRAAETGRDVRLRIVGDASPALRRDVARVDVGSLVEVAGSVSYEAAIREMCGADALVLYQAQGNGPITPVAGKTFEYLRAGRPILAVVPEGDNEALVRAHAGALRIASPDNPDEIARGMCELADSPRWTPMSPPPDLRRYERRALAAELAALFDTLVPARLAAAAGASGAGG